MKRPALWLSFFGLSSVLIVLLSYILFRLTSLPSPLQLSPNNPNAWETYKNLKHNFEFKYPNNLKLSETTNAINLTEKNPKPTFPPQPESWDPNFQLTITIEPIDASFFKDIKQSLCTINNLVGEWKEECGWSAVKKITDNHYFYQMGGYSSIKQDIFITKLKTSIIIFTANPYSSTVSSETEANQILSTFKFTD